MKRVLLVSTYPYTRSSRGMDVLTEAFQLEEWDTSHMMFPRVLYLPKVKPPAKTTIRFPKPRWSFLPYVDKYMHRLSRRLFNVVRKTNVRTIQGRVDFADYDLVVLESGKPLLLLPEIPEAIPLIYRQSDSVQLALGKGRHYCALADDAYSRADTILVTKSHYMDHVPPEERHKVITVENGMAFPDPITGVNPYASGTRNAVYVGLHPLDEESLRRILREIPDLNLHIVGPCLNMGSRQRLRRYHNFHYYRFLYKEDFMPMVEHADASFCPFQRNSALRWYGLTSKFLHSMYYQLPIISYPTGVPGEFDRLAVQFVETPEEFVGALVRSLGAKPIKYPVDFDFYSPEKRMDAYRSVVAGLPLLVYGVSAD